MAKETMPGVFRAHHVAITVPDLDAGVRFYGDILGAVELFRLGPFDAAELPRTPDGRDWTEAHVNVPGARLWIANLKIGDNLVLELFRYERPLGANPHPPRNHDVGGHHLAFHVKNIDEAAAFLRRKGVRLMDGPIEIKEGPSAGVRALYFLDPWGNQLELVEHDRLFFV